MLQLHLDNILQSFEPIHLEEMEGVELMNRVDEKFALPAIELAEILKLLVGSYKILEVDSIRNPTYESIYFDDDKMTFYSSHHRGKMNRFKVRFRKYVETDLTFLEVKHRYKNRTDKRRISTPELSRALSEEQKDFLNLTGVPGIEGLKPILTNKFKRITLVSIENKERLTFDFDLSYTYQDQKEELEDIVIAELKQEKSNRNSSFVALMKSKQIRPYRLSKYCIGVIRIKGQENIKYNRFKKKLLQIKKLNSAHAA